MLSPEQCRAARGWLNWTQQELATKASLSLSTIRDFEAGRRKPIANNLLAVLAVLKAAGVAPTFDGDRPQGVMSRPGVVSTVSSRSQ